MNEQMSIFDFLDIRNPQKPPEFDWNSVDWNKYPGLDVYYEAFPETPVYFVVKRMGKVSPLFYKALICTYTGWWHGLQGWNLDNKDIVSWRQIKNGYVKDFAVANHPKLAWTPEEYELIKNKPLHSFIFQIENKERL